MRSPGSRDICAFETYHGPHKASEDQEYQTHKSLRIPSGVVARPGRERVSGEEGGIVRELWTPHELTEMQ